MDFEETRFGTCPCGGDCRCDPCWTCTADDHIGIVVEVQASGWFIKSRRIFCGSRNERRC